METKLEQIAVKAVNQLPKSLVREIRTRRSVGAGGGRPPPATRWARRNPRPYRDYSSPFEKPRPFRISQQNNRSVGPPVINLSLRENEGSFSRHRRRPELRQHSQSAQVSLYRRQKAIGPLQKAVGSHGRQGGALFDMEM